MKIVFKNNENNEGCLGIILMNRNLPINENIVLKNIKIVKALLLALVKINRNLPNLPKTLA
jgi:hypothetical protein